MPAPNSILQNRYLIVRELGHGGMGTVYEAIDQRVSCVVALKQTLVGANTPAREAFQREAALLANLRHASLPKVMDYFSEGDGEFLVMEYIAGHDLAELLEQQQAPFPQDQVLAWADELLKLLDYLHTREPAIVHRDIKPANLKITREGEIFLLDFGLAKGAAGQMATVRSSGSVHGYTPLYAPLEQIHGQGTDSRSDIYSLGATLYDLLTGQPPVAAPVRFDAVENDRPDPLPAANRLNSRVSLAVAEVIQQAMALSRRNRFSSAAEMRAALQRAKQTMAELEAARDAAERALDRNRAGVQTDPDKPIVCDSNVEFTVYSPRQIKPAKNYTLLAFAHLAKKRDDAPAGEPDPIAEMKDQAARILGKQQADYDNANEPAGHPVPRQGEITFVPMVAGVTFSPASRTFSWRKSVHREEFDLWAAPEQDGQNLSGQMTVFLGSVVIAEVPLRISVNSHAESAAEKVSLDGPQSSRRLRQIYAAYSHQDEQVVAELAQVAPLFGSRFLTDRTHLEPGEDRRAGLQRLIRGADVFQLFWSRNAMRSADTVDEINYAVSLERPGFILPTYWEEPLPRSPADQLPPPAIDRLQFHRIYPGAISHAVQTEFRSAETFAPSPAERFETVRDVPPITGELAAVDSTAEAVADTAPLGTPPVVPAPAGPNNSPPHIAAAAPLSTVASPAPAEKCSRCGGRWTPGQKFCSRCGYSGREPFAERRPTTQPLSDSAPPAASAAIFSQPLETTGLAPQPIAAQFSPPPAATVNRKFPMTPIYAGAALALLVVLIVPAGMLFMMNSAKRNDASAPNSTANRNYNSNSNSSSGMAPDVSFAKLDGGTLRLRDFRGRVVLLNFWATWAIPSGNEIPTLNSLQQVYGSRGLVVIGISSDDTAEQVTEFQHEHPQKYLIGTGGKASAAGQLAVTALPTTYLIDRGGKIRAKFVGETSRKQFEAAIQPLLTEAP
jgi:serine/threonine protein kinase/peroxiredoxin